MKKLLLPFLFFTAQSFAQNLITNPGFEEYSGTNNYGDDDFRSNSVTGWFNPTRASSDFENTSAQAHSGTCSAGGYVIDTIYTKGTEYREYFAGTLTQPLVAGESYRFSMAVTATSYDECTIRQLGVYFTTNEYHSNTEFVIQAQPQIILDSADQEGIKHDWVILSSTFTAAGGEKYFVVGNFNDNAHSGLQGKGSADAAYYYFDDLCLKASSEPVSADDNVNGESNTHTSSATSNMYQPNNSYSNNSYNNNSHNNDQYRNSQNSNNSDPYSGTKVYDHYGDSITEKSDFHYEGGTVNFRTPRINLSIDASDDPYIISDNDPSYDDYQYPSDSLSNYSSAADSVYVEVGVDLISNNIYFDADEYVLLSDSYVTLDKIVKGLQDKPWINVEIHGWTENMKRGRYSRRLSRHRAEAVANYIVDSGVDKNRVKHKGCGPWQQSGNGKRVEFIFTEAKPPKK